MQLTTFVYTMNMKRLTPLLLTILIAVFAGFVLATNQKQLLIDSLLDSPSITDQLRGISLLQNSSLNTLKQKLPSILAHNSEASIAAQNLLVKKAFEENRVQDLMDIQIDDELYEAALWWSEPQESRKSFGVSISSTVNPSHWMIKLIAQYDSDPQQITFSDLVELPPRDRDGSVLLYVLAIEQVGPQELEPLIETLSLDYDIDRQTAAVLLAAMRNLPQPQVSAQNESLSTIQTIISENNAELAWRTLHRPDGTIIPDIALAGMIADQKMFTPIIIDSVQNDRWVHPEHPVMIMDTYFPEITNTIPTNLLNNSHARQKWWALFACGLLKEER